MEDNDPQRAAGVRERDVLAGKYLVERVLGAGGMGVVVAAHYIQLDEKFALRLLLPAFSGGALISLRAPRMSQVGVASMPAAPTATSRNRGVAVGGTW